MAMVRSVREFVQQFVTVFLALSSKILKNERVKADYLNQKIIQNEVLVDVIASLGEINNTAKDEFCFVCALKGKWGNLC